MSKLMNVPWFVLIIMVLTISCKKPFVIDPPIAGFETKFIEISVDPQKDSVYTLENNTRLIITKGSLLNSDNKQIMEPLTFKYRQFDDAVSIFLSGLPMSYITSSCDKVLETAGMFEIRGEYNGSAVTVDPEKPISVTIGSFNEDTRQGFFKLDEQTGNWNLIDIPDVKYNEEILFLRKKLEELKPEWEIPLPPNYYVFSHGRMADIFLGDNRDKIYQANMKALTEKMKGYGVQSMNINGDASVKYQGNSYGANQMLWKSKSTLIVPKWVQDLNTYYYDSDKRKYYDQIILNKRNSNIYELVVNDFKNRKVWSTELELVSHLRYLVRYSPDQLIAQQESIKKEIKETEARLKKLSLIESTVQIYEMGIYNCDRPVYFMTGKPQLILTMEGKPVEADNIHRVSVFNGNLSSYANPLTYKPITCAFFKGSNKIVLITKDGDIGLFSEEDFMNLDLLSIKESKIIEIALKKINVKDEQELREFLQ